MLLNIKEINDYELRDHKMKTLKLALYLGELLIKNGAETYRVEDSVIRVCRSLGYFHVNIFVTPTVIIISDEKFDGLCFIKTINSRTTRLDKISALNNFSRNFVHNKIEDFETAMQELKDIDNTSPYSTNFIYVCSALGSAFFSAMIGGNQIKTFIWTFFVAIIASIVYDQTMKFSDIKAFSSSLSSFVIALCGVFLKKHGLLDDALMLIVGAIMPLLPGVSFIMSIRDLISGNLLSGIARFFEACVIMMSIAAGVGLVLYVFKLGGGY